MKPPPIDEVPWNLTSGASGSTVPLSSRWSKYGTPTLVLALASILLFMVVHLLVKLSHCKRYQADFTKDELVESEEVLIVKKNKYGLLERLKNYRLKSRFKAPHLPSNGSCSRQESTVSDDVNKICAEGGQGMACRNCSHVTSDNQHAVGQFVNIGFVEDETKPKHKMVEGKLKMLELIPHLNPQQGCSKSATGSSVNI